MSFHPDDSPVQIKRVPARRSTQHQPPLIKGTNLVEEKSRFDERYHLRKENDSLANLLDGSHQRHPSPSFGHPIEANGVEATVKIPEQIQQLNKSGQQRSSAFRSVVDGAIGLSPNTSPIKPNVSQEILPPEATQETRNGVKSFSLNSGTKSSKSKESYSKSVGYKGTENGGSPVEHMNHGDAYALSRFEHKILPSLSEDQLVGSEATTDGKVGKDSFGQWFSQSSASASSVSAVSMSTSATATSARGISVLSSSPSYHIFNREKNIWKSSSALSPCPTPSPSSQTHPLMQATPRAHGRSPRNDCSPHDALGIVDYLIDHNSPSNLPTLGQPNIHAQQSSNISESHEQQKQELVQQQTVHRYQSYNTHEQDAAVFKERYEDGQGEAASYRQHPQGSLFEPPLLGRVGISNQLSDIRKPESGADPAVLLRFLLSASDDNNTSTDAFLSNLETRKQHSKNDIKERSEMASSDYMDIGSSFQSRVDSSIDSNTPLTPAFLHSKVYGANVADSEEFSLTSSVASSLNVGSSLGLSLALAGFESGKGSAMMGLSDRGARTFSSSAKFEPDPRQQLFPQQRLSVGRGTASADRGEVHAASSMGNFATNIVDAQSLQPHQQLQQPTRSHQQYLSDQLSADERGSTIIGLLEGRILGGGMESLQSSVDSNQYGSTSTIASSFSPPSPPHSSHHFERNSSIFGHLSGSDVRLGDRQPTAGGHETASSADGGGAASGVDDIFAVAGSSSQLSASAAPVSTDSIAGFSMPSSSSSQSVRSLLPTSSGNTNNGSSRHLAEVGGSIGGSMSAVPPCLAPPKFDNDFDTFFEMAQRSLRRRQQVDPWGVQVHGIGYGLPPTTSARATLSSLQDSTHLPPPHHHPPPDHHDHHLHRCHPLENSADSPFHFMPPPQSTAAARGSLFIHGTLGDSTIGGTLGGASWGFDRTASFGKPLRASDSEVERMRTVPQLSNSAPSFVPARTVSYQDTHQYAYSHSRTESAADRQHLPPNSDDRQSALPVQHQAQPPLALPYSRTFDHTNLGHNEPREHYRQLQQGGDLQCSVDSQLSRTQTHRAGGAQQIETLHTRAAYIGGAHSQAYLPPTPQQQFIQQFTQQQHPGSSRQVDYNKHHHSVQSPQYQQPHSQHQRISVNSQLQSLPPPVLSPHSNYSTSTSVFGGSDHPSQSAVQLSAVNFHAPSSGAVSVSSSFGSVDSESSFAQSVSSSISLSRHLQPATADTTTSSDHRYSLPNAHYCGGRPSLEADAPAEQLRSNDMYDGIATNDDSGTNDYYGDGSFINGGRGSTKGSTKSIDSRSRALIGSGKQAVREQWMRYDTTTTVDDTNGREPVGGSSLERTRERDTAVASSLPNQSFAAAATANTGATGGKKPSRDKTGVSKPATHPTTATTASDKRKADIHVDKVDYGSLTMKSQQESCSNAALATAQASEVNPISSRPPAPAPAPAPLAPSANNAASIAGTSKSTSSNSFYNFSSRAELVESPRSKVAHKEFFKHFRQRERESVDVAVQYAIDALETVPANAKWRVYLELADISKRNNNLEEARKYYASVCSTQPRASMGWIEWSKMEEENGKIRLALNILILGLKVCKISEALVTRVIKLHERLHKYKEVRSMLSMLKHESIDRVWKSVLEGSLFEARTGNIAVSRKLLRYLMKNVPWYGPIYYEAFRLEERENADDAALAIIHRGLTDLPRYGPLWFGLLRMMEKHDTRDEIHGWMTGAAVPRLRRLRREAVSALSLISKELVWKVHFELSQAEERAAEIAAQGHFERLKFYPGEGKDLMSCTPPRQHYWKEAHYSESTRPILWEDNQFVRNNETLARITASVRSPSSTAVHVAVESIDKPEAFSLLNTIESMCAISSSAREGSEGEEVGSMAVRHPPPFSLANVRGLLLQPARRALVKGLLICPSNLRWKLFLVGARLELSVGSIDKCRRLLQRAFEEVPIKSKAFVYLECARLEEYLGGLRLARELLSVARREVSSEWKLYLESILLEVRNGDILYALQLAAEAVQEHSGTGRLWAVYIQLCHRLENQPLLEEAARRREDLEAALQQCIPLTDQQQHEPQQQQQQGRTVVISSAFHSPVRTRRKSAFSSSPAGLEQHDKGNVPLEPGATAINKTVASTATAPRPTVRESVVRRAPATYRIMRLAIAQVPKSGEVWCERARCHLNPFNVNLFDLRKAQRSLAFAIQFTPQYGDTFIEYLRTEVLSQVLLPVLCMALRVPVWPFLRHSLCVDQEGDVADCCERAKLLGICAEISFLSGGGASRAEGTSTATAASPGVVSSTRELIQLPDDSTATNSTQQHSLLTGGKPRSLADSCEEEMFVRLPLLPPAPPTTSATAAAASLSPCSFSSRRQEGTKNVYNNASRDGSASEASAVVSTPSSHSSQAACEQPQQEIYIDGKRPDVQSSGRRTEPLRGQDFCWNEEECEVEIATMPVPGPATDRATRREVILAIERMEYDFGHLTPFIAHHVQLKHLTRRCVNADPNYGSAWFHCRRHPNENPIHVLENAHTIIAHDLVAAQSIYARALLRFLRRSLLHKKQQMRPPASVNSSNPSSTLSSSSSPASSGAAAGTNTIPSATASASRIQGGNTHTVHWNDGANSSPSSTSSSDNNNSGSSMNINNGAPGLLSTGTKKEDLSVAESDPDRLRMRQRALEDELLEDFDFVNAHLLRSPHSISPLTERDDKACQKATGGLCDEGFVHETDERAKAVVAGRSSEDASSLTRTSLSWPGFDEDHYIPGIETDTGRVLTSAEFVTGVLGLNRLVYNKALTAEEQRKHLFGSDQLIS